jgi:hypothetical protein
VTLKWRIRRRSSASTRNTQRIWNRIVGSVKKSTVTIILTRLSRKSAMSGREACGVGPCTCRRLSGRRRCRVSGVRRECEAPPTAGFPGSWYGADQLANVFRNARTTDDCAGRDGFSASRKAASPFGAGYNGFRLDDNQSGTPIASDSVQPRPRESIGPSQFPLLHRPMQDAELVVRDSPFGGRLPI